MLVTAVVAFSAICGFGKQALTLMPTMKLLVQYTILRWALGEFLVCWLAADHAFSELGSARRQGRLRDWLATPTTMGEIAKAFALSTSVLLMLGVVAIGVAEASVPYSSTLIARMYLDSATTQTVFQVSVALIITICHLATARYAAIRTTHAALTMETSSPAWASTLGRMAYELLIVSSISLAVAWCIATARSGGALWPVSFGRLRETNFLEAFLITVGVVNLAMKVALARYWMRKTSTLPTPDTVPDAG